MIAGFALAWAVILAGCWLGWQLLRQNGRILLRLDELEKRLDELEFGEDEQRAGLPLGTEAPEFELADLAGETRTLAQHRGQTLLLIFFNPDCGFCRDLLPRLAALPQGHAQPSTLNSQHPTVLIISTGDREANRQLFEQHRLDFPVLLQKQSEVAIAYQANGTPAGYLISEEGKIASQLAMGAEALLALFNGGPYPQPLSHRNGEGGVPSGEGERANRFGNRSLARSKIKRDGLKAGTPAPEFRLPRLDGHGELGLEDLRGRKTLLVFSSPGCGPCNSLAPELEKFHREQLKRNPSSSSAVARTLWQDKPQPSPPGEGEPTAVEVVMISKGEPKENRAKVKEHGLTFPVVLQQQWEISRRYAMFATPIAYLIDEKGVIVHEVAVGVEPILTLLGRTAATATLQRCRRQFELSAGETLASVPG
jgi:peroxiredoxin